MEGGGVVRHRGTVRAEPAPHAGRWRLPDGLVQSTRCLLWLAVVLSLALRMPGLMLLVPPAALPVITAVAVGCVAVWSVRYVRRRTAWWLDVPEAALIGLLATISPVAGFAFSVLFPALWFRAFYGSTRGYALFTAGCMLALVMALPLWGLLPGRTGPGPVLATLATLPAAVVTAGVARWIGRSLFSREESQHRDAALVELGRQLIGLTDRATIHDRARACTTAICAVTPGLSVMILFGEPGGLRVAETIGAAQEGPPILPRSSMPPHGQGPLADDTPLRDVAAPGTAWLGFRLPDHPEGWLLLGAPSRVPVEAVATMQSVTNQVALALRSSSAHDHLAAQARIDPLTGLANRAAFTAALAALLPDLSGTTRPALLFLDLDDFKLVNDGLGHLAGDELLQQIAQRLRNAVRPTDLCARLGGDEFAVLLTDADDRILGMARRLVELIAAPVPVRGRAAQVAASVGLAFATPGMTGEQLVRHADVAMYAAKAKGKNRVQAFDPSLVREDEGAAFADELARAAGQLVVHYQPIISVSDGRCTAAEALVRWQHPTRGLLGPGEFVPAAERSGAIIDIGAHVLRTACLDSAAWSRAGWHLAVHVNVSAVQLTDPTFTDTVRDCLAEAGIPGHGLIVEITESMVLDSAVVHEALDRLSTLGVGVAIDDFGTGYSALSTLRSLPLDIVKIDRSFLSGGPMEAQDRAVVEVVVQMAGRLGLQVVAEGVERPDQERFLIEVGATAVQGYLHLRPVPAGDLVRWLAGRPEPAGGTVTPFCPGPTADCPPGARLPVVPAGAGRPAAP